MKKSLNNLITLSLVGVISCQGVMAAKVSDVPKSHWAYESVQKVIDQGFMTGDPSGRFGGSRALTRYEFAKAMSRMAEYYNTEVDQNRKDLENVVSVMEMFQGELKTLESKMKAVDDQVKSQNEIVDELNELVVALGDEYSRLGLADVTENDPNSGARKNFEQRLITIEKDVYKLKNKGLLVGTLFQGTVNDFKKLGKATDNMVESINKQRFRAKLKEEKKRQDKAASEAAQAAAQQTPTALVNTKVEIKSTETVQQATSPAVQTPAQSAAEYYGYDSEVLEEVE